MHENRGFMSATQMAVANSGDTGVGGQGSYVWLAAGGGGGEG